MKTLEDLKRELLADPVARSAYEDMAAEFDMARELIAARSRAGMTQSDVAQRMGTTQSVIARLEGGKRAPSMRTVQRYAQAVGGRAVVRVSNPSALEREACACPLKYREAPPRSMRGNQDGAGRCANTIQSLTTIESDFKNG